MNATEQNDVPVTERGKEENLTFDEKESSAVFVLAGLSYLLVLLIVILAIGAGYLALELYTSPAN
ncbi:hypothetical protein SH528x_001989 [Novipirellula sp. SH528]|uniref:hypothetical protein n=1 Tax=Novipirellula sp. SH528 TaxID=3454466 RepID=UPI003F9F195E